MRYFLFLLSIIVLSSCQLSPFGILSYEDWGTVLGGDRVGSDSKGIEYSGESYSKSKEIEFYKIRGESDFPSYDGDVNVLITEEPREGWILIGTAYIQAEYERDELLGRMKEEAAKQGADTIVLFKNEPTQLETGEKSWSARAYTTKEKETTP